MAATLGLVLDCADPDKLAEFWSAAIGPSGLVVVGGFGLTPLTTTELLPDP